MRRHRLLTVFAAIVLAGALPGGMLIGCMAGPADPAMEQMACCKNGRHECRTSVNAKDCCDRGDHSKQQGFAKTAASFDLLRKLPLSTALGAVAPVPAPALLMSAPPVVLFAGTTSPPRLAFAVLLI